MYFPYSIWYINWRQISVGKQITFASIKMNKLLISITLTVVMGVAIVQGGTIQSGGESDKANFPYIIGGTEVEPHSVPWQAWLSNSDGVCGGSLISPNFVITAAHWCRVEDVNNSRVLLGAHDIFNASEETQQLIDVAEIIPHPMREAVGKKGAYDMCLLRLKEEAVINDAVRPIKLPSYTQALQTFAGYNGTATGWGITDDGTLATGLTAVTAPITSNEACVYLFGWPLRLGIICMDGTGIKGVCSGDSGGPLMVTDTDGSQILLGVSSFINAESCKTGYPSGFARVSTALDWIADVTGLYIQP